MMNKRFKEGDKAIVDLRLPFKEYDRYCKICGFGYKRETKNELHCKTVTILRSVPSSIFEDYIVSIPNDPGREMPVCNHVLKPIINTQKE